MRFDYCIGNPPYQVSDGGAKASAKPVYQLFSTAAKDIAKINCFVQPARWMTGGKGLDDYRKEMLEDRHIKVLHDYADSHALFQNVDIKGGVCIYLRDADYEGDCKCVTHTTDGVQESTRPLASGHTYIRIPILIDIKDKVMKNTSNYLSDIVSARKPYALAADTMRNATKYGLPEFHSEECDNGFKILGLDEKQHRCWKYLPEDYPIPKRDAGLFKFKVFIAEAYGCGNLGEVPSSPVPSSPVLSSPGELCTETFLQIGPFDTKIEAINLEHYIHTKFFRVLVGILKQTQHTTQKVYKYVPMQDFTPNSDIDWSKSVSDIDKQLYKKYNLTKEEIDFIESHVKEME